MNFLACSLTKVIFCHIIVGTIHIDLLCLGFFFSKIFHVVKYGLVFRNTKQYAHIIKIESTDMCLTIEVRTCRVDRFLLLGII